MQAVDVALNPFDTEHLVDAVRLSAEAGWPHRLKDWQMSFALSKGVVAVDRTFGVVGTLLVTPYGAECATINMVIVDKRMRGRGLGRRLMEAALELAGDRPLRLVATTDGLPLYEKLGFQEVGVILQHQGAVKEIAAPEETEAATSEDFPTITTLDSAAYGARREDLIARLAAAGEFAVIRRDGRVVAFATIRTFGHGEAIGPIVAPNLEDAKALAAHFMSRRGGSFLRVDTGAHTGLAPWLTHRGLIHVGGGIAMARPPVSQVAAPAVATFALANQALG